MKVRNHPWRDERRAAARELRVVDLAAPDELIFERPGERHFRILLHVSWQHRVATAADGHVQRGTWTPGVGQGSSEANSLDEPFGFEDGRHRARRVSTPPLVAIFFNLRRQLPPHL